jgi:hypothetical protein
MRSACVRFKREDFTPLSNLPISVQYRIDDSRLNADKLCQHSIKANLTKVSDAMLRILASTRILYRVEYKTAGLPMRNQSVLLTVADMSKIQTINCAFLIFVFSLTAACGGSSGGSAPTPTPVPQPTNSTITGSVVNSPVSGATIEVFALGAGGIETAIIATSAPITTNADGTFSYPIVASEISAVSGPLIIRSTGGSMNLEAAPQLKSIIPDPTPLTTAGGSAQVFVTIASSVATEIVIRDAAESGAAPTSANASAVISRVENGLRVSFEQDPAVKATAMAFLNLSIDANLDLINTPANNLIITDLIEYLVLNFRSSSGKFDATMINPDDPSNRGFSATFHGVGSGQLASMMPEGPSSCVLLSASLDKTSIENDGLDTAWITASLMDAKGAPASDVNWVNVDTALGRLVISNNNPTVVNGSATTNISSVWAGDAAVTIGVNLPVGRNISQTLDLPVEDNVADVDDAVHPRIVSAGSTSNTELLVSFSEAMRGGSESAENPTHYRIVAVDPLVSDGSNSTKTDNPAETPEIMVSAAELILPDRTTVRLKTFSQSDLSYELSVTNMTDLVGNTMAPPDGSVNPSTAIFQGIPPSGGDNVDTDGDGLSDADEQRGWIVTSVTADGVILTFEVTSDPLNADTDGDGISDADEFQGGMNPRTADTDGDTLTDYDEWYVILSNALNQDTDGDGLEDGLEVRNYHTSPILDDTDGDQILDADEVSAGNRNPLVADLPSPRIKVGNVNLQLDTRFTYTDESGNTVTEEKGVENTLSRSENETFSTSNENSTKMTLEFSQEIEAGWGDGSWPGGPQFSVTAGSKQGSERGNTFTVGEESGRASEETFNNSLTTSSSRDIRKTVTREVIDAAIKIDLSIENVGNLPFTIRNLELSAQTQNPRNRRLVIPIASLVPENSDLDSINIGALGDSARGPFVFQTVSVFPRQVEELLKSPRGLVVKLANFDITDEAGRNFAFTSRDVLDRTAGISFDLGDGRVESYRVATTSLHEPGTGKPLGITMAYALNNIIGFQGQATIKDGGNGVVDTLAMGDDLQVFGVGMPVTPGAVIITPGPDGTLNTSGLNSGDDIEVEADFETTAKIPTGEKILTRFRDVETGFEDDPTTTVIDETKLFWVLYASKDLPRVDLDKIVLHAGDQFNFTFVQDQDDDGVWAREEFLHGSSDLLVDTDYDGLTDAEEIQEGWLVQVRGSREAQHVYPNPVTDDSDRDLLLDRLEESCGLDPRQRDTDLDGLTDWEELHGMLDRDGGPFPMLIRDAITSAVIAGVPQYSGAVLLDGGDQMVDTVIAGDDVYVYDGTSGGIIATAGPNGAIESAPGGDDFRGTPHMPYGNCKPIR